jgi:hypothetical protein
MERRGQAIWIQAPILSPNKASLLGNISERRMVTNSFPCPSNLSYIRKEKRVKMLKQNLKK